MLVHMCRIVIGGGGPAGGTAEALLSFACFTGTKVQMLTRLCVFIGGGPACGTARGDS